MKMIQLTLLKNRDEIIQTQYGLLKYSDWISKEKERIDSDTNRKTEIKTKGSMIALYVDQVVPDKEPKFRSWRLRNKHVKSNVGVLR